MSRPFHTIPTTECYTVDLYILGIKEEGITTKLQPPHKFMIKTQFSDCQIPIFVCWILMFVGHINQVKSLIPMFGSYIKPHFFMLESGSITMFAAFNQHFVWLSQVWLSLVKSQFYCVSVACFVSFLFTSRLPLTPTPARSLARSCCSPGPPSPSWFCWSVLVRPLVHSGCCRWVD